MIFVRRLAVTLCVASALCGSAFAAAPKLNVITFVGDHGYHLGEHTQWGKTSNFEHDAGVPFFIGAPGEHFANGKSTRCLAELLDLFPTLVDLCGLPKPGGLEGVSLVPTLIQPNKFVKTAAFTQHPRPAYYDREPDKQPKAMGVSVRTTKVRYTEWRDWKSGALIGRELYGNADEPRELRGVLDDPQFAMAQREAEALLRGRFPVTPH